MALNIAVLLLEAINLGYVKCLSPSPPPFFPSASHSISPHARPNQIPRARQAQPLLEERLDPLLGLGGALGHLRLDWARAGVQASHGGKYVSQSCLVDYTRPHVKGRGSMWVSIPLVCGGGSTVRHHTPPTVKHPQVSRRETSLLPGERRSLVT